MTLNDIAKELREGCGGISAFGMRILTCGVDYTCGGCEAKLQGFLLAIDEVEKVFS